MRDFATSSDPAVQKQLDRLAAMGPGRDLPGLERVTKLLGRLGHPERALPPVLHVAGTNGKGSVCAFLRACLEAAGRKVHVYTSPHLVRFNERIRVAGRIIGDEALAPLLAEVLDKGEGIGASFFEATTAAALLAFSRAPADACVVEVGLGGRLDATNVVPSPLVCGIAQLGIDHQAFLGRRLSQIAAEKAGIARAGVPLVTEYYPARLANPVGEIAAEKGAAWLPRGGPWDASVARGEIRYRDGKGRLSLPLPRLPGRHQAMNAALAVAMLRHQERLEAPESALRAGLGWADWPARLQLLSPGPLRDLLPAGDELWLDGAHNPAAARAVASFFRRRDRPLRLVLGLLANRPPAAMLKPFVGVASRMRAVPVPGHEHHDPERLAAAAREEGLAAEPAADLAAALEGLAGSGGAVLICGSLYLAGEALRLNSEPPR